MRRGRRRDRSEPSIDKRAAEIGSSNGEHRRSSFFACYLLCSLSPRHKGCTYIGFTTNPRRRIRQHNGEIRSGAWRTKRKRPWEMILCIYGFPTNVSALQFEWAWQHPVESLAVREAAAHFKSLSGIANKIKLAYTMLSLPSWENLNLTVNFFSSKYMKFTPTCPSLPKHMKVLIHAMDELPCYVDGQISDGKDGEDEDEEDNDIDNSDGSRKASTDAPEMEMEGHEEDNDIDNSDGSRKASTDAPEMEMEGHDLSEWIEFDDFGHPTEPSYSLPSSPSPTTESQKINSSDSLEDTAEVFISMEATTPTTKIMKQFYDLVSPDVTVNRLLVPSNSTIDSCNKRVLEVIDLTDSPIYIPL